jgi:myo-inositol-1(or 4)-monophosphatase
VTISDILMQACSAVYEKTKNIIGTVEGSKKFDRGAGGDVSTKIDLVAEQAVIETIRNSDLNPTIIGEECGKIPGERGLIIMDAIDGTTNANRGIPFYCCSLAYSTGSDLSSVVDAAIIDLARGDIYHASRNKGAYINSNKLKVTKNNTSGDHTDSVNDDILIGMNLSGAPRDIINRLAGIISGVTHTRLLGANALELCYLARGFTDAFVDFRGKIRTTDMAAAYLVVKESGGKLYSMNGSELDSKLETNTGLSFLAVRNSEIFYRLAHDLHIFD